MITETYAQSREFECDVEGHSICGQHWEGPAALPTLALHGWLDNAASFTPLAPLLPQLDLWAIDLPGHGHSDHRPVPGSYNLWDDLLDILALADQLGWERFNLLAHSRGALIANLLAATMPERIAKVVLLDGIWPMPVVPADAPSLLRQYLLDQRAYRRKRVPHYQSLDEAIVARHRATGISQPAARLIVERGIEEDPGGGFRWRSDPRLTLGSAFKLTEEHIQAFLEALSAPVLVLLASEGFARYPRVEETLAQYPDIQWQILQGSHHMHMETPELLAAQVAEFINSEEVAS